MFYNFSTHSLDYVSKEFPTFSLALHTLELEYRLVDGRLIDITGFLPLLKARNVKIKLGKSSSGSLYFKNVKNLKIEAGDAFDIFDKIPEIKKYFIPQNVKYDKVNGIIQLGCDLNTEDQLIKISKYIFCGIDTRGILKCIYLLPKKFIA